MAALDILHTKYFRNLGPRFVMNAFSKTVGLILTIALARYLGPSQLGYFSFVVSVAGIFGIFFTLGLPGYLQRNVPVHLARGDAEGASRLVSAALWVYRRSTILLVAFAVLSGLFAQYFLGRSSALLLFALAAVYAVSMLFMGLLESLMLSLHRLNLVLPYGILRDVFRLVLTLATICVFHNFVPVVLTYALVFGAYAFFVYRTARRFFALSAVTDLSILRRSLPYLFFGLASMLLAYTDILMLSYFRPMSDVGYYRAASLAVSTITALLPFTAVSLPTLSRAAARGELRKKFIRIVAMSLVAAFAAIFLFYYVGPFLILFFYGQSYTPSIPIFRILLFLIPASFVYSLSVQAIISKGGEWEQIVYPLVAGSLNVILNYFFIQQFGTIGAAYATVASMWIAAVIVTGRLFLFRGVNRA
ncbi:MAG: oligosaccharide flippase family protein [Candidatus Diapherotrites archaeon]|nr:oligosaccharide flippase family protein [Candidatus Diapherotrites archaeon]